MKCPAAITIEGIEYTCQNINVPHRGAGWLMHLGVVRNCACLCHRKKQP